MRFLADAHEQRGVLRQAGASYQFRHAELQRHLTDERHLPASTKIILYKRASGQD
jgi:hypothetical protein